MEKIKFSVLMSVYYKEKPLNLKLSIDSIIKQTLLPDEIVLVEDGPLTEELYDLIDMYKKKYKFIKVIKLKENVGLGRALNEGLKNCSYEYVARMDSDDISHLDRFEKQISYMITHPEVDIIGSNIIEYDECMNLKIAEKRVPETNDELYNYLKQRNPFNHMSVIYKKSKVIEAGNYLDCPLFEDYYLWARMAKNKCVFYNIQECLLDVRAGLSMVERRGGKSYAINILNFQKKLLNLRIINKMCFLKNLCIRIGTAFLPSKLRMKLYKNKLRNN